MNSIFDYRRKSDRNCLVDITGTIYLYARKNNLAFVQCVREVGECLLDVQKKPDNNMAKYHEGFIAKLIGEVIANYLVKFNLHNNLAAYHEIGHILKTTSEKNLNFFASWIDSLQNTNEAKKTRKRTIRSENPIERISKHINKIFNTQED